jgi:N-acetylneuraminic acid mutarotase
MSSRWEEYPSLPYNVSEAQGGLLGNDFVVFSGFVGTSWTATRKVFALDTSDLNSTWREMDDVPVVEGITHTGHVVVNFTKFYMCGGYVGSYTPHPKPTDVCYLYEHTSARSMQWTQLPSLPEKRAGGGMVYDESRNSLIFSGGANFMNPNDRTTIYDNMNTWELQLDSLAAGWTAKTNIPYAANHIGYASVNYQCKQQHYFLGGQKGDDEKNGNVADMYEYMSSSDTWAARPSMLFPRSHFSSSTIADSRGCGLFKMGGAVNGGNKTSEIHYYSIQNSNWTKIGNLKAALNTPVCVITPSNYLYCQGGNVNYKHSWRVQLLV